MNQQAEASSSRITPFISRTPKWQAKTAKQRRTQTVRFRRLKVVAEIDETEEWRECHPEAETAIAREEFERRLDLLCSTNLERQQRIMTKRNTAKNGKVNQAGLLELYSVGRDSLGSLPVEDHGDLPSLHPRNLAVFTDVTYDLTERGGWVVNEQQERTALEVHGHPSRSCKPGVIYSTNDEDAEIIDAPVSQRKPYLLCKAVWCSLIYSLWTR